MSPNYIHLHLPWYGLPVLLTDLKTVINNDFLHLSFRELLQALTYYIWKEIITLLFFTSSLFLKVAGHGQGLWGRSANCWTV